MHLPHANVSRVNTTCVNSKHGQIGECCRVERTPNRKVLERSTIALPLPKQIKSSIFFPIVQRKEEIKNVSPMKYNRKCRSKCEENRLLTRVCAVCQQAHVKQEPLVIQQQGAQTVVQSNAPQQRPLPQATSTGQIQISQVHSGEAAVASMVRVKQEVMEEPDTSTT